MPYRLEDIEVSVSQRYQIFQECDTQADSVLTYYDSDTQVYPSIGMKSHYERYLRDTETLSASEGSDYISNKPIFFDALITERPFIIPPMVGTLHPDILESANMFRREAYKLNLPKTLKSGVYAALSRLSAEFLSNTCVLDNEASALSGNTYWVVDDQGFGRSIYGAYSWRTMEYHVETLDVVNEMVAQFYRDRLAMRAHDNKQLCYFTAPNSLNEWATKCEPMQCCDLSRRCGYNAGAANNAYDKVATVMRDNPGVVGVKNCVDTTRYALEWGWDTLSGSYLLGCMRALALQHAYLGDEKCDVTTHDEALLLELGGLSTYEYAVWCYLKITRKIKNPSATNKFVELSKQVEHEAERSGRPDAAVDDQFARLVDIWMGSGYGRVPTNPKLAAMDPDLIRKLRPCFKHFLRLVRNVGDTLNTHGYEATAKAVIMFEDRALAWLTNNPTEWERRGGRLTPDAPKRVADWVFDRRKSCKPKDLCKIMGAWSSIEQAAGKRLSALSMFEASTIMSLERYSDIRDQDFALECSEHDIQLADFKKYQKRWLKAAERRETPGTYETIPHVDLTVDGYRFHRLAKDDPRGLFLGEHTDCCQHPGGAGSTCAWHGVESDLGGFYVVERKGRIVAQSWAWRPIILEWETLGPPIGCPRDILVLDNVELLSNEYEDGVTKAYQAGVYAILGRLGVAEVLVGAETNDLDMIDDLPDRASWISTPENCYTDASMQKVWATIKKEQ